MEISNDCQFVHDWHTPQNIKAGLLQCKKKYNFIIMQVKPHLLVSKIMCLKVTHLTGMGGMPGKTLKSMRAKPKFDNEHRAKDPAVWKSEL